MTIIRKPCLCHDTNLSLLLRQSAPQITAVRRFARAAPTGKTQGNCRAP